MFYNNYKNYLDKNKSIVLEGTHCSGKTTIANRFAKQKNKDGSSKYIVWDELVRELAKTGNYKFDIGNGSKKDLQDYFMSESRLVHHYISHTEASIKLKEKGFVSHVFDKDVIEVYDRCVISPLFYMKYFLEVEIEENKLESDAQEFLKGLYDHCLNEVISFKSRGMFKDMNIIVLEPLPLDLEDDFRLKGEKVQKDVFKTSIKILDSLNIDYTIMHANDVIDFFSI